MTEEDKKKLALIRRIDDLKIIANNNFMIGKLEEAIKNAEEIIPIAQEGELPTLVQEQEEFIAQCRALIEKNKKIKVVKDELEALKPDYEKQVQEGNIAEAHSLVLAYKEKFSTLIDLNSITTIRTFLVKENKLWEDFTDKQRVLKSTLSQLESEMNSALSTNEIETAGDLLNKAKAQLEKVYDADIKHKWTQLENEYLGYKNRAGLIMKVDNSITESYNLKESKSFDTAKSNIEAMINVISDKGLPDQIQKLEQAKQDIIAAEENYHNLTQELVGLESKLKEAQDKDQLKTALSLCERIVQITQQIGNTEKETEYTSVLEDLRKKYEERRAARQQEAQELSAKAEELKSVIEVDENVMPLVEEFSVSDLLGTLSSDVDEMLAQVGGLLKEHRVEIKNEITNSALLTTASGEMIELDQVTEVQAVKAEDQEEQILNYQVQSGFTNDFNDAIEEGILTDLIPYNFEISNVEFNGEEVQELPDKTLTKEGIEITWKVQNVQQNEKVEINYDLRRRVSRTIIFILKDQVKIVKTHSNITELSIEGLFETKMPFNNAYGVPLDGVVLEDIVPIYYLNNIIEPKSQLPAETTKSNFGNIVKWNIGSMEAETRNYHYKLLEIYKYEELKIKINQLNKTGLEDIENGEVLKALRNFEEIRESIVNYLQ